MTKCILCESLSLCPRYVKRPIAFSLFSCSAFFSASYSGLLPCLSYKQNNTGTREIQIHIDMCIYKELDVKPGPLPMCIKNLLVPKDWMGLSLSPNIIKS